MWKIVFPIFATCFAFALGQPGGTQDADVSSSDFQSALNFAVARYNRGNYADRNLYQVDAIVSAQVQVVEGSKYTIVVNLGRTNCIKGEPNYGCTIYTDPAQAQTIQCKFVVWTRPWLNNIQVLNAACFEV